MTLTRSQRGLTPRKTEHPGYVETPTRRRTTRQSDSPLIPEDNDIKEESVEEKPLAKVKLTRVKKNQSNGSANGSPEHVNGSAEKTKRDVVHEKSAKEVHYEFGGPLGVSAIMVGFPLLMYYMWIGATYYDGGIPTRSPGQSYPDFLKHLVNLVYTGAFPSLKAWTIWWSFFLFEIAMYCLLPGVKAKGQKLPHEGGKQLDYHCSGIWAWYVTIATALGLHVSGLFPLYTILDEFGPIMSVAIISGIVLSIITYVAALARGKQHRMTGNHVYDFFMGAELNPRLFKILDLKMFYEVRIPWYMLFLISCAAGARQYEQFGYISGEVAFLIMAHWLYANACAKGEELIVTTWDMYYEKLGFMLTFWNLAGVPLSYCHCSIYLANHAPEEYRWNRVFLAGLFISYLFVYWVWDTCNGQKNTFRRQAQGGYTPRKAFPQLPWQSLKNPKVIETTAGKQLLVDGWYGLARKVHYSCDTYFAITWGLVTGFKSPYPWFYAAFFVPMIIHRAIRDVERCRETYGEAWEEYERRVPYLFIPYVF